MILEIIVLSLFISTILNIILNRFNMPTIIWYILTWTIISYVYMLNNLTENTYLKTISEFGIVFLMFTIWLEFSIKNFIKMRKNVFIFWWLQVFSTFIVFFTISYYLFSLDSISSILISLWLSLSSTAVVIKILNENWNINKEHGNNSLWILLFQDLMVIPILILINIFSNTDANIWFLLWKTFLSALILIFVLWISGRYLLDYFLYRVSITKSNEIFIWSILFIIIWASLLAHTLGFSYSLWALIAWVLIAETHYKHQVEADLIPFRDLLLWFFFITVWMQLDIKIIYDNILVIFTLLFWLLVLKIVIMYFVLIWFNPNRTAFKTALTLFQFWEFWIVIFQISSNFNLIDDWISQILILVIILSMIITPIILRHVWEITDYILWNKYKNDKWLVLWDKLSNHVVLIWYWRLWKILSWLLENKWVEFVIIESYIKAYNEWKRDWKPIIFWNAFQANTLKHVNIEQAKTVLISVGRSDRLFMITDVIKKMNIHWNIVVKVNNFSEEEMLREIDIKNIIVETEKTALSMISKVK